MLPAFLRKVRFVWCTAITSLITFAFLLQVQLIHKPPSFEHHKFWLYELDKEEPQPLNQICQLPKVHPFDSSILSYLTEPRRIKCKRKQPVLTYLDENGVLRFNQTALKIDKYNAADLQCYYQEIIRKTDFKLDYGEKVRLSVNGSKIHSDFVYVFCTDFFTSLPFYSNIHCHIVPKSSHNTADKSNSTYNVLIFGLDSMSRLSFIRNLPETYEFLTKTLNAFVFRGLTKIGDNTFPNLIAMLTGKYVYGDELPKIKDPKGAYDKWPYVWKNFSRANYVTLFAEDLPSIGLFTYLRGGLNNPPTDHYLRPFWLAVEESKLYITSSSLCFGNIPKHLLQLSYAQDFIDKYTKHKKPFFAFSFYAELSHDYARIVSAADNDFKAWLEKLFHSGHLNNTFVFFLSDHGHRFDAMRSTLIGRIEERMPFLAVVAPPSLFKTHPEVIQNLNQNVARLTTPYDIYFSLLDILGHSVSGSKLGSKISERGTSMFGEISSNRTCETAGVPDHYCVCEKEESLDVSDTRCKDAAQVVLPTINGLLQSFQLFNVCSALSIETIKRCDITMPSHKVIVNSRLYFGKVKTDSRPSGMLNKLRTIIETTPGGALFEATVQFREDEDSYTVLGDISRINKYGSQSACIHDATMRKYCYCIHQGLDTE